jgi:hypothetical protein
MWLVRTSTKGNTTQQHYQCKVCDVESEVTSAE